MSQEPKTGQEPAAKAKSATAAKEKFHRVKFHAKSNPNDQEDVELSCQGETLIVQREREVCIPERFVEVARNARYPQFRQMPNEQRKIVGHVMVFPFDVLGEGTEEDYLNMKRSGTKSTRDAMKQAETASAR